MKKLNLHTFKNLALSSTKVESITGGQSFCEWYLDRCDGNPEADTMQTMMALDMVYGGEIPSDTNMNIIAYGLGI